MEKKTIHELRDEYYDLTGKYPCAAGYGLCSSKEDVSGMIQTEKERRKLK